MKIATKFSGPPNASSYYRLDVPFRTAQELDLVDWFDGGQWPPNDHNAQWNREIQAFGMMDGVVSYTTAGRFILALIKTIHSRRTREPVPFFITDIDDLVYRTSPLNPRFAQLGTRNAEGKPLTPGQNIAMLGDDGDPYTIWEDGKNNFDIARNQEHEHAYNTTLTQGTAVTVTTPRLRDAIRRVVDIKDIFVLPNLIAEKDWVMPTHNHNAGEIRVLWQGADGHYQDWYAIKDGLATAAKRFPEIKWVIWGAKYKWIEKVIPADRIEWHKWVPYEAYKYKLATLNFDISIAPLTGDVFNQCKSAIKWYEATLMGAPSILSNVPPYSDEATHNVNALMYRNSEEFVECIEALVRDTTLRKALASNARDWISDNRDATKVVPGWVEWLTRMNRKANVNGKKRFSRPNRKSRVSTVSK